MGVAAHAWKTVLAIIGGSWLEVWLGRVCRIVVRVLNCMLRQGEFMDMCVCVSVSVCLCVPCIWTG